MAGVDGTGSRPANDRYPLLELLTASRVRILGMDQDCCNRRSAGKIPFDPLWQWAVDAATVR
jgi:hypothetical protein